MIIRRMTDDELENMYPILFQKVFGYYDATQLVDFAILGKEKNGSIIGFAAFRFFKKNVLYLSFTGVMPEYRRTKQWELLRDIMVQLAEDGIEKLLIKIEQKNTAALIVSLKMGFYVYGVEKGNHNDLLINMAKTLGE